MLSLRLLYKNTSWDLYVLVSICKTSCDKVWQNMSQGNGILYHSLVGMPNTRLHDASSTFTNMFCSLTTSGGLFPYLACFVFLNVSTYSMRLVCVEHSLFPAYLHFPHNHWRCCGQGFFGIYVILILFRLHHHWFYHLFWALVVCWHLDIGNSYHSYHYNDKFKSRIFGTVTFVGYSVFFKIQLFWIYCFRSVFF